LLDWNKFHKEKILNKLGLNSALESVLARVLVIINVIIINDDLAMR